MLYIIILIELIHIPFVEKTTYNILFFVYLYIVDYQQHTAQKGITSRLASV